MLYNGLLMIYTSIKYLRIGLVTGGFLLLVLAVFFPDYSGCTWNSTESGTIPFVVFGYESRSYWIPFFFTIAAFFSGYFYQDIANKALLYTFSSLFLVFVFLDWNAPAWGATPCERSTEIGGYFSLFGSLFVILGTFISVYRETE